MTTLVTADLHLSDNSRDYYRIKFLQALRKYVDREDIAHVLILGDLCEDKDRHGAWLVNTIVDELTQLAELARVTLLKGNHDYIDVESPFYAFLGRLANVEYVGAPTKRERLSRKSGEAWGRVLFLPHTPNYKRDWADIDFGAADWVFCHNTFQGADAGFGRELDGIPTEIFGSSKVKVISGDVHVPQKLGPVTYVGAPYTIDFGDSYEPRVLLIDEGKVRSFQLRGPQKRLVEINSVEELNDRDDIFDGDIVKVRVNIAHDDYQNWPSIRASVFKWGEAAGVQVHQVVPIVAKASVNQKKRREDAPRSDEELLEEYAKHRGVDKRTLRTGLLLMQESDQ
jgi:hypothetical protein